MVMVCSQGGVQFPAVINHLYGYFPCPSPGWRPELLLSSLVLAVRQLATSADAAARARFECCTRETVQISCQISFSRSDMILTLEV